MFGLLFALARLASAAWVGAATLFVIVAVRQTTSPQFDAVIRDHLALLRFPPYYLAGALLIGVSLFSSFFLRGRYLNFNRWLLVMACLAGAGALMAYDWKMVYTPLVGMITPPGKPRPDAFATLHRHSEMVNGAALLLVFFAALLLCWPGTRPTQRTVVMPQEQG